MPYIPDLDGDTQAKIIRKLPKLLDRNALEDLFEIDSEVYDAFFVALQELLDMGDGEDLWGTEGWEHMIGDYE